MKMFQNLTYETGSVITSILKMFRSYTNLLLHKSILNSMRFAFVFIYVQTALVFMLFPTKTALEED